MPRCSESCRNSKTLYMLTWTRTRLNKQGRVYPYISRGDLTCIRISVKERSAMMSSGETCPGCVLAQPGFAPRSQYNIIDLLPLFHLENRRFDAPSILGRSC